MTRTALLVAITLLVSACGATAKYAPTAPSPIASISPSGAATSTTVRPVRRSPDEERQYCDDVTEIARTKDALRLRTTPAAPQAWVQFTVTWDGLPAGTYWLAFTTPDPRVEFHRPTPFVVDQTGSGSTTWGWARLSGERRPLCFVLRAFSNPQYQGPSFDAPAALWEWELNCQGTLVPCPPGPVPRD